MTCDPSGGTVSSSGTPGLADPDSAASLATIVLAPEGLALPDVAPGIVAELASADAGPSPSPAPPAVVVVCSANPRALGDPDMGVVGANSASGLA